MTKLAAVKGLTYRWQKWWFVGIGCTLRGLISMKASKIVSRPCQTLNIFEQVEFSALLNFELWSSHNSVLPICWQPSQFNSNH